MTRLKKRYIILGVLFLLIAFALFFLSDFSRNYLVKNSKAMLLTDAEEIIDGMGWQQTKKIIPRKQKELFIELSAEEKIIIDILKEKEAVHIDELNFKSGMNSSIVAASILTLELQNVILSLPGKLYRLA